MSEPRLVTHSLRSCLRACAETVGFEALGTEMSTASPWFSAIFSRPLQRCSQLGSRSVDPGLYRFVFGLGPPSFGLSWLLTLLMASQLLSMAMLPRRPPLTPIPCRIELLLCRALVPFAPSAVRASNVHKCACGRESTPHARGQQRTNKPKCWDSIAVERKALGSMKGAASTL